MPHTWAMGLLDRFRHRGRRGGGGGVGGGGTPPTWDAPGQSPLLEFVRTRRGVEGFVEPRTTVTDVTLLLVAHDGEWTRRRVPSVHWAHEFANKNGVPSYDAALVGVPARMREYNRREKERQKAQLRRELGGPTDSPIV